MPSDKIVKNVIFSGGISSTLTNLLLSHHQDHLDYIFNQRSYISQTYMLDFIYYFFTIFTLYLSIFIISLENHHITSTQIITLKFL